MRRLSIAMRRMLALFLVAIALLATGLPVRADNWKGLLSFDGSRLGHFAILLNQGETATVASLLEGEVDRGTAFQEISLYVGVRIVLRTPQRIAFSTQSFSLLRTSSKRTGAQNLP